MLGTRGSSGLASVSNEQTDSNTLDTVSAGDQLSLRMSRQMFPLFVVVVGMSVVVVQSKQQRQEGSVRES